MAAATSGPRISTRRDVEPAAPPDRRRSPCSPEIATFFSPARSGPDGPRLDLIELHRPGPRRVRRARSAAPLRNNRVGPEKTWPRRRPAGGRRCSQCARRTFVDERPGRNPDRRSARNRRPAPAGRGRRAHGRRAWNEASAFSDSAMSESTGRLVLPRASASVVDGEAVGLKRQLMRLLAAAARLAATLQRPLGPSAAIFTSASPWPPAYACDRARMRNCRSRGSGPRARSSTTVCRAARRNGRAARIGLSLPAARSKTALIARPICCRSFSRRAAPAAAAAAGRAWGAATGGGGSSPPTLKSTPPSGRIRNPHLEIRRYRRDWARGRRPAGAKSKNAHRPWARPAICGHWRRSERIPSAPGPARDSRAPPPARLCQVSARRRARLKGRDDRPAGRSRDRSVLRPAKLDAKTRGGDHGDEGEGQQRAGCSANAAVAQGRERMLVWVSVTPPKSFRPSCRDAARRIAACANKPS